MSLKELNIKKEDLLLRLKTLDLSETDLEKCLSKCNSTINKITNKSQKAKDANLAKNELKEKLKVWINSLTQKTDVCTPFQYDDLNELYRSDGKIFIIILEEVCKSFVDRHFWKALYESNDDKLKSIAEFISVLSIPVTDFAKNIANKTDSVIDVAVQLFKKENEDTSFNDVSSDYELSESISYEIENIISDSTDEIDTSVSDEVYDISSNKENKVINNSTNIAISEKTYENNPEIVISSNNELDLLMETASKSIPETSQDEYNRVEENLHIHKEKLEIYDRWRDELLKLLEDCKDRNNLSLELSENDKLQNILILCKHLCGLIDKVKTDTFSISYFEDDISSIEEERCSFVDNDFVICEKNDNTLESRIRRSKKTKDSGHPHTKQNINTDHTIKFTNDYISDSKRKGKERVLENVGNTILSKISMNENHFSISIKHDDSTDSEYFDHTIQTRMKKAVEFRKCINEKMKKIINSRKCLNEGVEKAITKPKAHKEISKGDNQNRKIKKSKKLNRCCL